MCVPDREVYSTSTAFDRFFAGTASPSAAAAARRSRICVAGSIEISTRRAVCHFAASCSLSFFAGVGGARIHRVNMEPLLHDDDASELPPVEYLTQENTELREQNAL